MRCEPMKSRTCQHKCPPPNAAALLLNLIAVAYLGDLDTPVEQQLRPDVVLVLVHVVEQAAVGHELGDQLDGRAQADAEQAHQVGVFHAGHDQGLLGKSGGKGGQRGTKKTAGNKEELLLVTNTRFRCLPDIMYNIEWNIMEIRRDLTACRSRDKVGRSVVLGVFFLIL